MALFYCHNILAESSNEPTAQYCSELIPTVTSQLSIYDLAIDSSSNTKNQVLDFTCKYWPENNSKIILAFAYGNGVTDDEYKLIVAVVSKSKIISSYSEAVEQNAVTYIESGSLKIDTAKYQLTNQTRAFGLRANAEHHSCGHERGASNDFRLFVIEGEQLKIILSGISLSQWQIDDTENSCSPSEVIVDTTESYISVSPDSTNGFHDLIIKSKHSNSNKVDVTTLRYNGKVYPLKSQTN